MGWIKMLTSFLTHLVTKTAKENEESEEVSMVELLTTHGAEVNAKDKYGQTPLHFAAMTGNIGAASVLVVDCGASVEVRQGQIPAPCHTSTTAWESFLCLH